MPNTLLVLALFFTTFASAETNIWNYLVDVDVNNFNSGIDKVDCVYVINLERRLQKWIETRDDFIRYGVYPNRVKAVEGWALSEKDKQSLSGSYPLRLRGGQMGCILSHISALQDAYKRKYEVIWVCEDDIQICENPYKISGLISKLSEIDHEWDILYTDSDSKNHLGQVVPSMGSDFRPDFEHQDLDYYTTRESITEDIVKIHQRFGAYSMIISRRRIQKILNYFLKNYLWTAYDIDIHYIRGINQYCIKRDWVSINWKKPSDTEINAE